MGRRNSRRNIYHNWRPVNWDPFVYLNLPLDPTLSYQYISISWADNRRYKLVQRKLPTDISSTGQRCGWYVFPLPLLSLSFRRGLIPDKCRRRRNLPHLCKPRSQQRLQRHNLLRRRKTMGRRNRQKGKEGLPPPRNTPKICF